MNLYTEQQMRDAIKMARNGARSEDNIIDSLNFIKQHSEVTMSNNKQSMNTYRKIATVQAKLFEEGDEDGFISRFYNDEDVNEDGSISTSGFMGKNEIQVPYVSTLENQKHLSHGFGREYLCVGIDGERWLVEKSIFERTYEKVIQGGNNEQQ